MTRDEKVATLKKYCDTISVDIDLCDEADCKIVPYCDRCAWQFRDLSDDELDDAVGRIMENDAKSPPDTDPVSHPKHYTGGRIECIDAMIDTQGAEAVKAFCVCNAFKYLWRHCSKNGTEDIAKATWYLNKALELARGDQNES